jgi:hypothetical protein
MKLRAQPCALFCGGYQIWKLGIFVTGGTLFRLLFELELLHIDRYSGGKTRLKTYDVQAVASIQRDDPYDSRRKIIRK